MRKYESMNSDDRDEPGALPRLAVRGWTSSVRLISSQGSSETGREVFIVLGQEQGDARVELHLSRPTSGWDFERFTGWTVGNLARRAPRRPETQPAAADEERADELERAAQRGEIEWAQIPLTVDDSQVAAQHFSIRDDVWMAVANLSEAYLGMAARGVLVSDIALVRTPAATEPQRT
jgi:hypothetical protein